MPTQGPNSPATAVDDSSVGSFAWASLSNVFANDTNFASAANMLFGNDLTHYIKITNYGFSIPGGSTINGIEVTALKKSINGVIHDNLVKIVKGGVIGGTNHADTSTNWSTIGVTAVYGGAADLWGLSWTDTDINASTFGVAISATGDGTASKTFPTPAINYVSIKIYYSAGSVMGSCLTFIGD